MLTNQLNERTSEVSGGDGGTKEGELVWGEVEILKLEMEVLLHGVNVHETLPHRVKDEPITRNANTPFLINVKSGGFLNDSRTDITNIHQALAQ